MIEIGVWVLVALVGAIAWLGPKYLEKRVTEAARGAVDLAVGKALADHTQVLTKEGERYARDYGLFAEERNKVYAETFSMLERARGAFSQNFASLTMRMDYSRSSAADLRGLLSKLEFLSSGEKEELTDLIDRELGSARRLANELAVRNSLRSGRSAFYEFRNAVVINALYYDPVVESALDEALEHLSLLTVYADELLEGEDVEYRERSAVYRKLEEAAANVKEAMRAEMRAGFATTVK